MECKCCRVWQHSFKTLELIDTLWNVNIFPYSDSADDKNSHGRKELIDTLWNVNIFPYSADDKNSRINRYIMECKCRFSNSCWFFQSELIDTLWNVNICKGLGIHLQDMN